MSMTVFNTCAIKAACYHCLVFGSCHTAIFILNYLYGTRCAPVGFSGFISQFFTGGSDVCRGMLSWITDLSWARSSMICNFGSFMVIYLSNGRVIDVPAQIGTGVVQSVIETAPAPPGA